MSETAAGLTRTHDGRLLPTPGTFGVDPAHSIVGFVARHMMIAKVRGRFRGVSGTLVVPDDPLASTLEIDVETATIDTGEPDRDGHLRSADFLDVETYPAITYRATGLTPTGGEDFRVDGELSVHGVTQPVPLEVTFEGVGVDPWGNQRIGFTASGEIDRETFGLTWNQALETGGVLVGKTVKLEIEAEFVRQ